MELGALAVVRLVMSHVDGLVVLDIGEKRYRPCVAGYWLLFLVLMLGMRR